MDIAGKAAAFVKSFGLLPVVVACVGLSWMFWDGAVTYLHRKSLEDDGVAVSALVTERIFKHCYGFRCSSPEYFSGKIGSAEYDAFDRSCGKACWRLLRYRLSWNGRSYEITESVKFR
ncbi:MAG: hypothetical protein QM676_15165 [Novosphingobium sp.]